jgi:hypothetical protein
MSSVHLRWPQKVRCVVNVPCKVLVHTRCSSVTMQKVSSDKQTHDYALSLHCTAQKRPLPLRFVSVWCLTWQARYVKRFTVTATDSSLGTIMEEFWAFFVSRDSESTHHRHHHHHRRRHHHHHHHHHHRWSTTRTTTTAAATQQKAKSHFRLAPHSWALVCHSILGRLTLLLPTRGYSYTNSEMLFPPICSFIQIVFSSTISLVVIDLILQAALWPWGRLNP